MKTDTLYIIHIRQCPCQMINALLNNPMARQLLRYIDLTSKYLRVLKQFAPFGPKNMRPVFIARNIELASVPRTVGKNHLRLKVRGNGLIFDCIGFGLDHLRERIEPGNKFYDIVFSIDESDFTGVQVPQLKMKDLRKSGAGEPAPITQAAP